MLDSRFEIIGYEVISVDMNGESYSTAYPVQDIEKAYEHSQHLFGHCDNVKLIAVLERIPECNIPY